MSSILIIDDSEIMCNLLSSVVKSLGHSVSTALTMQKGLSELESTGCDIVFLDVVLPDGNGLDYIQQIKNSPSSPEVIIVTGNVSDRGAELAIQYGAWDYIEKGATIETITLPLVRALQYRNENKNTKAVSLQRDHIIGSSPSMKSCLNQVAIAANSESNVLIAGESGTGKELLAYAIHANSPRASKNFVIVDCAALPETLVESMLFGHEKGAFTGAEKNKEGLIVQAREGTLFLDEIGELSPSIQKAFLRVLQERRFRPVGGERECESNFRLVSATNKNLDELVERGSFRDDLLFRLRGFQINVPSLRERVEDIKEIALHHINQFSEHPKLESKVFSPEFIDALNVYPWPGNVRELIHALDRAHHMAGSESRLYPQHLPDHIRIYLTKRNFQFHRTNQEENANILDSAILPSYQEYRDRMEKEYLIALKSKSKENIDEACNISGLSRSTLYAKFQKYSIN